MAGFDYNYSIVIHDYTNAIGGDFSPGEIILFVDNPTHIAWTTYANDVGEAFFSISQDDPKTKAFKQEGFADKLNSRPHMMIYRNGRRVWGGWVGEVDETGTDLIIYGYSYESGYYDLLTTFDKKYTGQTVKQIVDDVIDTAHATTDGRINWFNKGTVENPWTDDTKATGLSLPLYKAYYKRHLVILKELSAYSISDTTNKVLFEVDPTTTTPTFNMWADRDATKTSNKFSYPYGQIRSYRRIRRPVNRRSRILAVGSSPTSVNLNKEVTNSTLLDSIGLSAEPIYFSFVKDATELDRVAKQRLVRANRVDHDLFVSFYRNSITPYRATDEEYRVGDNIEIVLESSTESFKEQYVVAGQQVIYYRKMENVRLLLADRL